jgi:hypothetical protein
MGANGQNYMLTYDMESEMWMAMHMMPDAVSVMLGDDSGGTTTAHGGKQRHRDARRDCSWPRTTTCTR